METNIPLKGTIVKRMIRGKARFYHQWREDGKTKSRYLKPDEILPLREALERSRHLPTPSPEPFASPSPSPAFSGRRLDELAASVSRLKPRALLETILSHPAPVLILIGATGSGKTTLLHQAIAALTPKDRAATAYLSLPIGLAAGDFLADLDALYARGIRRFYIDGLERAPEVESRLPALADTYAALSCRFTCASRTLRADISATGPKASPATLATTPISFADFVLMTGENALEVYLDSRGLAADVTRLAPPLSPHLGAAQRKSALAKLRRDLAERLLKDILLREMHERRASATTEVFTLELPHGGMDIVVADAEELTCELFEVHYSFERNERQLVRLTNGHNLDQIEHRYGMITSREVFYLGRNAWHATGVYYRNAANWLLD